MTYEAGVPAMARLDGFIVALADNPATSVSHTRTSMPMAVRISEH
jgi:hypothetical protein